MPAGESGPLQGVEIKLFLGSAIVCPSHITQWPGMSKMAMQAQTGAACAWLFMLGSHVGVISHQ